MALKFAKNAENSGEGKSAKPETVICEFCGNRYIVKDEG